MTTIVMQSTLPRCAIHQSGAITVGLEEHDLGLAEKVGICKRRPDGAVLANAQFAAIRLKLNSGLN
jgi:hypothetical protein